MVAFIISQLAGLTRRILVARAFGASSELDAFIAANRVSETLFNLIAGGALGSAFIPAFTSLLARRERNSAWSLASAITNLVFLVLSFLGIVAFIFAPAIVKYALAPGLANDPHLFALTISLLRIQLVSAVLFGLSGLVMGILNSHQVFLIPALTPAMYQIGMIFGVLVLTPSMGIFGLAWGVVIGASLHLLLQVPSLLKQKGSFSWTLGVKDPNVSEVIRLMLPRLLGVAVVQLNFWVNSWLATQMSPGSLVGIDYGFSLMLMAQVVIAQSLATALLPTLSMHYALDQMEQFRNSLSAAIRGVLFLSLPAALGLIILRHPIISLLYQRGSFTTHSTDLVAWALMWYAAGLVGHSLLEVLARSFYSLHDTRTPVMVGIGAMVLNVILSFAFSNIFTKLGWMPHGGLALANSTATTLEAITLLILMNIRLKGLPKKDLLKGIFQAAGAGLLMVFSLMGWLAISIGNRNWIVAAGGLLTGFFAYLIGMWILQVSELKLIATWIGARIRK